MSKKQIISEITVRSFQSEHPEFKEAQELIDSGAAWLLEGSVGRHCMNLINTGACFLPALRRKNSYGGIVPSQDDIVPGTMGSLEYSFNFYSRL